MAKEKKYTYLSKDGRTTIHATIWNPNTEKVKGIVQVIHGMQEYTGRYENFAKFLNRKGYIVVGQDLLGHGDSICSKEDWGYFAKNNSIDILLKDQHHLRKHMEKIYPGIPYYFLGHSMGSYLLRKYICHRGQGLAGVIIMGTGYVSDRMCNLGLGICGILSGIFGENHRSCLLKNMTFSGPYHKYDLKGINTKNSWLTKDEAIVEKYYSDEKCSFQFTVNGYETLYRLVRYCSHKEHMKKIPKDLPVLLLSGADDPVGNFGSGVAKVYKMFGKVGIKKLSMRLYKGCRHEILNEKEKDRVYLDIYNWLRTYSK